MARYWFDPPVHPEGLTPGRFRAWRMLCRVIRHHTLGTKHRVAVRRGASHCFWRYQGKRRHALYCPCTPRLFNPHFQRTDHAR